MENGGSDTAFAPLSSQTASPRRPLALQERNDSDRSWSDKNFATAAMSFFFGNPPGNFCQGRAFNFNSTMLSGGIV